MAAGDRADCRPLGFDYGCLLAALRATGASPRPSLVLLAYSAADILALLPVTPGGLGIVEASLSGLLICAVHKDRSGISGLSDAVPVDPACWEARSYCRAKAWLVP